MREIKFTYTAQHEETGCIMHQIFTIEQIEGSDFVKQWQKKFKNYKIISRRIFTECLDIDKEEIYEDDIIKFHVPATINSRAHYECGIVKIKNGTPCLINNKRSLELNNKYRENKIIGNIYDNPDLVRQDAERQSVELASNGI